MEGKSGCRATARIPMSVANMVTEAQYVIIAENVDEALEELFDVAYISSDDVELVGVVDMLDGTYQFGFNDVEVAYTVNYCI